MVQARAALCLIGIVLVGLVPALPAAAQDSGSGRTTAQERVTGPVTIERPPPAAQGMIIERPGAPPVLVPRGSAVDVTGANLVVVDETPRGTRLTVQNDVLFEFDRAALRPEAELALRRVAQLIRDRHPRAVRIIGHTDAVGSEAYNQALSERRARAVEHWLASAGAASLPPLHIEGRGEREPVAPNEIGARDNPDGRQQNRRVEILLER
ncbi:MAG: OmpA family protein [Acetobacteraceae bacterium]|nr:OmpA family protein [Acetobacteraceae bacterium]